MTDTIIFQKYSPKLNLVGGRIQPQDKFKFLELFGSKMSGIQEKVYNQAIDKLIRDNPDIDLDAVVKRILFKIISY